MNRALGAAPAATDRRLEFGYAVRVARTPAGSGRIGVRLLVTTLVLTLITLVLALTTMTLGDYPLSLTEVLGGLTGTGEAFHRIVVVEWRAPVAVSAIVFGALLGIGGAIFQSLTRNPLGSPDVIGFDAGSYTAVVLVMLVAGSMNYWAIAGASIAGGLVTALIVYLLAWRRGIQGFRLIVVGIGVAAMLGSINSFLLTRAQVDDAISVGFWAAGSLTRVSWTSLIPSLLIAALIVFATWALAPSLRMLELGDDAAVAHGARPDAARLGLMVTGVACVALVTAAAGPIGFIALAAPQLAKRLTRAPGVSVLSAAAMGAFLLTAAQLTALVFAQLYRPIPVGLITISVGGLYLIWLLLREVRAHTGRQS